MVKNYFFWGLLIFFALQCLVELFISRRNEKWIKENGGVEFGKTHFKWVVMLMIFFFIALPIENFYFQTKVVSYWPVLLILFIFAQCLRYSSMMSLGRFWNTRIWIIPNSIKISKGLYRYMKHPNYLAVIIDLVVLPLMIQCYITAFVSFIGYLFFLRIRIPSEENALSFLREK